MLWALHRLATLHERRGEYGQAESYARRQLELEPWSEEAHRQLMRLLALSGQRSAALAQYKACRRLLAHELGVDPERETTALYESIRDGEVADRQQVEVEAWTVEPPQPSAFPFPAAVPPFVDREAELAKLDRFLDLALAGQGQFATGIDLMRQSMAALRALGTETIRPHHLALLAKAYGRAGQAAVGLSVLAEAQRLVEHTGMRLMAAELYRLRGEMLLAKNEGSRREVEAENCYRRALEVARRQQARSWELRATTSLARLWHFQGLPGRTEDARETLAKIYGWFTEGLDTLDLREARVLLEDFE